MGTSIFTYIKQKIEDKQNKSNIKQNIASKQDKDVSKKGIQDYINMINANADNILKIAEPKIFSLARENNIAFKYDEKTLITKDGNLCIGIELKGASYAGLDLDKEFSYLHSRMQFFGNIKNDIEMNIIVKKDKIELIKNIKDSKNIFANEIINKWENHKNVYQIKYYLIISTIDKKISGALESFKDKSTREKNNDKKESYSIETKKRILEETLLEAKNKFSIFSPTQMTADDIINFYATYSNGQETKFKYSRELITDCYISSDLEFKKDYIIYYKNDGTESYARFISIKAYETESITSMISTQILRNNNDFIIFMQCQSYEKKKAIKKIKDTGTFAPDIVREELAGLLEQVNADREFLTLFSYSVYIKADSLQQLEEKTNELKNILTNHNLNVVRETLNQKALFFSFFPSRGNLNARKRTLKVSNLATIANFENDILGFNKNDWGEEPVTIFRHLNGTPFLFNFHCQPDGDKPSGHTMIIGGTGSGKTTLAQFLMCNLYKYDIEIFSMDKLRGMYNFTAYTDGEYHDDNDEFKLNPFAMEYTMENRAFLSSWLQKMASIEENNSEAINIIEDTLDRIYSAKTDEDILMLANFVESLPNDDNDIKSKYKRFLNSIFNNKEDALSFKKQLSILNMDSIIKNSTICSLTALYIFHRLKNTAKNSKKRGFFCFIDELKDFLLEESMRESILEAILEVRKIGGVMCMGFQSLSFFNNVQTGSSFLENIANFIIFPTTNAESLKNMQEKINLTDSEIKFLQEAGTNSRQVLLKMPLRQESAILNVDLSRLGHHIKIFSSSSDNVMRIKELKQNHPNKWREMYLNQ